MWASLWAEVGVSLVGFHVFFGVSMSIHVYVRVCRTDAVALLGLVGVLHVYFISSCTEKLSPRPVFYGHCTRVRHTSLGSSEWAHTVAHKPVNVSTVCRHTVSVHACLCSVSIYCSQPKGSCTSVVPNFWRTQRSSSQVVTLRQSAECWYHLI